MVADCDSKKTALSQGLWTKGSSMAVKLDTGFEIVRYSDLSYEGMTVEIRFGEEAVAQLNKDAGPDKIEIEIYKEYLDGRAPLKFTLAAFLEALNRAREMLVES